MPGNPQSASLNSASSSKNTNNILIRGLSSSCLTRIDELAKLHHMSRSEYLRTALESFTVINEVKDREERERRLYSALADIIEENTATLKQVREILEPQNQNQTQNQNNNSDYHDIDPDVIF